MAVIGAEDSVTLQLDVADRRQISQEAATAIQRARGGRRSAQPKKHYTEAQKQMRKELLVSRLPADDHRADADVDDDTRQRALGTLFDRTPAAVSAWHPASWIAEPSPESAGSAQALGLVLGEEHTDFPEGPSIPTQAHATLSAATRNALSGLPPPSNIYDVAACVRCGNRAGSRFPDSPPDRCDASSSHSRGRGLAAALVHRGSMGGVRSATPVALGRVRRRGSRSPHKRPSPPSGSRPDTH